MLYGFLMANGPTGGDLGDVKEMNTVIASSDIVAADSYATTLFGMQPEDIGYIRHAGQMGLGHNKPEENFGSRKLSLTPDQKVKIPFKKKFICQIVDNFAEDCSILPRFIIFISLFISAANNSLDPGVINLPMRLDPLLALSHLISSRLLLAGSTLALIVVLLTVIFGRAWCGWVCPLGTILDWFKFGARQGLPRLGQEMIPAGAK